jgi:hypothetical protein
MSLVICNASAHTGRWEYGIDRIDYFIASRLQSTHITYIHPTQPNLPDSANGQCWSTPEKWSEIPGHASREKTNMSKPHENRKKRAQPISETNALATRKKLNTTNRKQTPPIQSSIQTHMDLWNSAMGNSFQFHLVGKIWFRSPVPKFVQSTQAQPTCGQRCTQRTILPSSLCPA